MIHRPDPVPYPFHTQVPKAKADVVVDLSSTSTVVHDLDGFGNSGPGWATSTGQASEHDHRYSPILSLPITPDLALCLCCHWIASGPDAAQRAAAHRDETSHAVIAGTDRPTNGAVG